MLQFLYASAHVMKLPLFSHACELAFAESDTKGNGYISEHEVRCSYQNNSAQPLVLSFVKIMLR